MPNFITISSIEIRSRQRQLDPEIIAQLKESITSKGLLHAPVTAKDDNGLFLVAGEHRIKAVSELHEAQTPFFFDGHLVPSGMVPAVSVFDLSPADLMEAELEENVIRAPIPWQDRFQALAAIHKLRLAENPNQTYSDTARYLDEKQGKPTEAVSGRARSGTRMLVRNAVMLSENMHRPSIAKARNPTEALGILLKEEAALAEAALIRRRQEKAEAEPPPIRVIHGDLTAELQALGDGIADLIIADLPYGIDANSAGHRSRTVEHHNYDDSPEEALRLMQSVIADGFRVCKARANLFIFGDIDLFQHFKRAAAAMGWKPFRTPIVWRKSESEGLAPWGREGFRRTYELIFFATKGQKGLLQSPVDILDEKRVARNLRRYGAEKPVGLLEQLIECSTMPGDLIIDPCCGSGSTLAACRHLNRKAIGIEKDEAAYALSVVAAERDDLPPKEGLA